jgi:hypothetical protein
MPKMYAMAFKYLPIQSSAFLIGLLVHSCGSAAWRWFSRDLRKVQWNFVPAEARNFQAWQLKQQKFVELPSVELLLITWPAHQKESVTRATTSARRTKMLPAMLGAAPYIDHK